MTTANVGATDVVRPVSKWIWPGLLIALPASVIVASAITAVFVVQHPDGLVASDYYKQGKAINAQLAKLERARALGMHTMQFTHSARGVVVHFPEAQADSTVEFVFAHPVDAAMDVRVVVSPSMRGQYEVVLAEPFKQRRRVIATDATFKHWRAESLFTP